MKDRQNRETEKPLDRKPQAEPSMDEKDTSEERQYKDKSGENTIPPESDRDRKE